MSLLFKELVLGGMVLVSLLFEELVIGAVVFFQFKV